MSGSRSPESNLQQKDGRQFPLFKLLLVGGLVIILVLGFTFGMGIYSVLFGLDNQVDHRTPEPRPNERINILALGVDAYQEEGGKRLPRRSDTMLLVSVDPVTKEVGVLSLPRDTRVQITREDGGSVKKTREKLAHAHAYGGPVLAMETVEDFLEVPVHYFIRLDFEGFEEIVDSLGGVTLNIEEDMHYEDPTQNLEIHFEAGKQHLDGEEALKYVRYRNGSDIARIERQHKFLNVMLDKMFGMGMLVKLPRLAREMTSYVDTNLPADRIIAMAKLGTDINKESIIMDRIPGEAGFVDGVSYWLADEQGTQSLVDRLIRGIDREFNATVSVRVLNATNINRAAARMGRFLEARGYDVVEVANAGDKKGQLEKTEIYDCCNDELAGKLVGRDVMSIIETAEIFRVQEGDGDGAQCEQCDVIVIIGPDFPREFSPEDYIY